MWHIQLGWGGWEEGRDVDAQQAGDWHVHGAQFSWGHTENEPDAGHLVTLTVSKGKKVESILEEKKAANTENQRRQLYSY